MKKVHENSLIIALVDVVQMVMIMLLAYFDHCSQELVNWSVSAFIVIGVVTAIIDTVYETYFNEENEEEEDP